MKWLKSFGLGLVGSAVFLLVAVMLLAILKVICLVIQQDLLVSKYNIAAVIALFAIAGFIYGVKKRKTFFSKFFGLSWASFWMAVLVSLVVSLAAYIILKDGFRTMIEPRIFIALLLLTAVLIYPFCALIASYFTIRKTKQEKKRTFWTVAFNPVFAIISLWLFAIVAYNAVYTPCGVVINGIDKNENTASTMNLGIRQGERIVSIDSNPVMSLNDVKRYVDSLDSTKEILVETEDNIYYIKTYSKGNSRYMGLILSQAYCQREY